MALLRDGIVSTVEDLTAQDSGLLDVAATERIDLEGKLELAQGEVEVELQSLLDRGDARAMGPQNVVVSEPLKLWHTFHTLAIIYRDAYHNQLNDRYKGKWNAYRDMARWAAQKLAETGVGLVFDPVPKAAAPEMSEAAGQGSGGTYFARVAWVNAAGEEGLPGDSASITVAAGSGASVRAVNAPANARGWNLYAGTDESNCTKQNGAALEAGQSAIVGNPASGPKPGAGQTPNRTVVPAQLMWRG